jgi:hypothetical protein
MAETPTSDAVRRQLERLLADAAFSSSKRYPRLLRYVVEETLAGRTETLKERVLGAEVFGRDPGYDTDQDPVVRTSAAQVRQRLALYYQDPAHAGELRIELVAGSYVPQFRAPEGASTAAPTPVIPAPAASEPAVDAPRPRAWRRPAMFAGATVLAAAAFALAVRSLGRDPVESFWGPVWDKANPIVICVPGRFPTSEDEPLSILESLRLNSIAWPDATTLYAIVGFIQSHGQTYHVRRAGDSALSDLRNGASLLIGGLNNPWLMRLTARYRFSYRNDAFDEVAWIEDAQNPGRRDWRVAWSGPYSSFDEDYGIVSRVWDPTTERIVVTASGIASYGTIAAGEFLTNPKYLAMIDEQAPAGWERKSVQVVFSTKVFNGNAGPPRILAIHVW